MWILHNIRALTKTKAQWAAAVRCVILTYVRRGDERRGESIEGGKNAAPLLCLSRCRRRLTVDLAPATSHQTLCATETNVALCWMSFPHYGSNGPEMASEWVSVCERVVVATHDQFQFLCLVDFFFTPRDNKQQPWQYLESTSCAQRRSLFLYRELTTFCQRRKWPVQCESHFKSCPANVPSLLSVLLTSLPPSASPHAPSSSISSSFLSSSADNPWAIAGGRRQCGDVQKEASSRSVPRAQLGDCYNYLSITQVGLWWKKNLNPLKLFVFL